MTNSSQTSAYGTIDNASNSRRNSITSGPPTVAEKPCHHRVLRTVRANLLVVLLILALGLGIGLGAGLRNVDPPLDYRQQMYLRFPGEILMNMLQLLILPLIVSSLISGLTSLDTRSSGTLGVRAILYYFTSTLMAVVMGIILVLTIKPGERGDAPDQGGEEFKKVKAVDTFLDLIRQMFPDNIIEACFLKRLTELQKVERNVTEEEKQQVLARNETIEDEYRPILKDVNGINMLGLVVFSVSMGVVINKLGPKGKPLKDFVDALCEATLQLVTAVIWYSPIGVMFLVAAQVVEMDDPKDTFEQLSFYFLTVMAGLAAHGFISLPLLYFALVRKNPYRFLVGMLQAMLTALGTASSSATLPVTMRNLEENNGVDPRVTSFVVPVGATINMDGTALYEAVAVIFIGQVRGFDMDVGKVITVCLTATAAAVGAAGVPQAGLVTMVIVLTSVGFPTQDVGMILAIDWLLDRFRTMVNVLGDAYGAGIIDHFSQANLRKMDEEELRLKSDMKITVGEVELMREEPTANKNEGVDNAGFDNSRL